VFTKVGTSTAGGGLVELTSRNPILSSKTSTTVTVLEHEPVDGTNGWAIVEVTVAVHETESSGSVNMAGDSRNHPFTITAR
jgi:hypothetical protein